jgi:hypothetical protein
MSGAAEGKKLSAIFSLLHDIDELYSEPEQDNKQKRIFDGISG